MSTTTSRDFKGKDFLDFKNFSLPFAMRATPKPRGVMRHTDAHTRVDLMQDLGEVGDGRMRVDSAPYHISMTERHSRVELIQEGSLG